MPDHPHLIIYFDLEKYPELTISRIVQLIKGASARQIIDYHKSLGSQEPLLLARIDREQSMEQRLHATRRGHRRGLSYRIWQPGFYDFNIYTARKFSEKLEYIHKNPIRDGLVTDISQYKYCSWRNYELNDHSIFKINYQQD